VKCTYIYYIQKMRTWHRPNWLHIWERARMSHTAKDRYRNVVDSMDIGSFFLIVGIAYLRKPTPKTTPVLTGPLSTTDPCWLLMTPFCCCIMTSVSKMTHNKLKLTSHSIVKTKFEETSCIDEDAQVATASCSSHPRRRSDCAHSLAASTLLLVDFLMHTFGNRFSSPPRWRSDWARSEPTRSAAV